MAPHVLHMTATPIPRTLSLTAYGDLDTTALHELPAGRRPVETRLVEEEAGRGLRVPAPPAARGPAGLRRLPARRRVRETARQGGRGRGRAAAGGELRGFEVGVLHGQMPSAEKAEAMRAFAAGETDVLVATTVIEVGIDVANATVMVIEGAERFGVSQLHQLRGRVGRGEHPSQCLLFAEDAGRAGAPAAAGGGGRARRLQARRGRPRRCAGRGRSSAPASTACRASPSPSCPRTCRC